MVPRAVVGGVVLEDVHPAREPHQVHVFSCRLSRWVRRTCRHSRMYFDEVGGELVPKLVHETRHQRAQGYAVDDSCKRFCDPNPHTEMTCNLGTPLTARTVLALG